MAKKQLPDPHSCRECLNADLHQWFQNPVIAICWARKLERFPASCIMRCQFFKPRTQFGTPKEPSITHHDRYE